MGQAPIYYRGIRASRLPRASQDYGEGRACKIPGCITKVSIYNPHDQCWQHVSVYLAIRGAARRRVTRGQ
jgi:hypothetical protein